jgi:hypothetical protein
MPRSSVPNNVADCCKIVVEEDSLTTNIICSKEMEVIVHVRNVFTHEVEISYIDVRELLCKQCRWKTF